MARPKLTPHGQKELNQLADGFQNAANMLREVAGELGRQRVNIHSGSAEAGISAGKKVAHDARHKLALATEV